VRLERRKLLFELPDLDDLPLHLAQLPGQCSAVA
jgi:hypothetical protein